MTDPKRREDARLREALETLVDEADSWPWKQCAEDGFGGEIGFVKSKYAVGMLEAIAKALDVLGVVERKDVSK